VRFNYHILNKEDAEAVLPWDVEHHDDTLRSSYIPHEKWVLLYILTAFTIDWRLFSPRQTSQIIRFYFILFCFIVFYFVYFCWLGTARV
jgi:hypothetical protein